MIDPYLGYATPDALIVRGRVLSKRVGKNPSGTDTRLRNFSAMMSLFLTNEVAGVEVRAGASVSKSDSEGYFTLHLPRPDQPGWHNIALEIEGLEHLASCQALVPRSDARFLVISDIDDTVLKTGAYSIWKNLWTSLTGNALTRVVFPDAVKLMDRLSENGRNPIFYVSSSPWNFHDFLQQVFWHARLVQGPVFLRDLGLETDQFITGTHGSHKGDAIDTILAANPERPAILMGDTGQHDAEIYRDAISRHPGRIHAVVLREPGPAPSPAIRAAMGQIEQTGTPLYYGPSFEGVEPWTGLP